MTPDAGLDKSAPPPHPARQSATNGFAGKAETGTPSAAKDPPETLACPVWRCFPPASLSPLSPLSPLVSLVPLVLPVLPASPVPLGTAFPGIPPGSAYTRELPGTP